MKATRRLLLVSGALLVLFAVSTRPSLADTPVPNGTIINGNTTWTLAGSPYIVDGTVIVEGSTGASARLTIEPGVEIRFRQSGFLRIGLNGRGNLIAQGTSTAPIRFTAEAGTPAPGFWIGMSFGDLADDNAVLEHVVVEYAGRGNRPAIDIARSSPTIRNSIIRLNGFSGLGLNASSTLITATQVLSNTDNGISLTSADPLISNSTIRGNLNGIAGVSASPSIQKTTLRENKQYGMNFRTTSNISSIENTIMDGVYFENGSGSSTFRGNTITTSAGKPLRVSANTVGPLFADNSVNGLDASGRVEVIGEAVNRNATWPALPVPYRIIGSDIRVEGSPQVTATLTLAAGAELQFEQNRSLLVGQQNPGALRAIGSATTPITLTTAARFGRPGDWLGLTFGVRTDVATTQLQHLDVAYAGRAPGQAILFDRVPLTIRDSVVRYSNGNGIQVNSAAAVIAGTQVLTTTQAGVQVEQANLTLTDSVLANNEQGMVINRAAPIVRRNRIVRPRQYGLMVTGQSAPTVDANTIEHGLFFRDGSGNTILTGNTVSVVPNLPLRVGANLVGALLGQMAASALGGSGRLEVIGEVVNRNATWPALPVPYRIIGSDIRVEGSPQVTATLTLAAGAELQFERDRSLLVGQQNPGALRAIGSATTPITLTSVARFARPGDWLGLAFGARTDVATTQLQHLDVAYAGRTNGQAIVLDRVPLTIRDSVVRYSNGNGIQVNSAAAVIAGTQVLTTTQAGVQVEQANLTLTDSVLANNEQGMVINRAAPIVRRNRIVRPRQYGLMVTGQSAPTLDANTIEHGLFFRDGSGNTILTGNTVSVFERLPLRIGADKLDELLADNTLQGIEAQSHIEIVGERITKPTTWENVGPHYKILTSPVEIWGESSPITLTLAVGVRLAFDRFTSLVVGGGQIQRPGTLIAEGTEAQPIVFTSAAEWPAPGDWNGIQFRSGTTNDSVLSHSIVEFGNDSNVSMTSASPTLEDNTIRYSQRHGISVAQFSLADIRNNTIVENQEYGILLSGFANARIRGNTIEHGIMTGFFNNTSQPIISQNTFLNYRGSFMLKIPFVSASGDLRGNRFQGTDSSSHIQLYGAESDLTLGLTLPDLNMPYVIVEKDLTIGTGGMLAIEPGVELQFSRGRGMTVSQEGRLMARGTETAPIIFTSNESFPEAGDWRGITVASRARSMLEHCQVSYAGSGDINQGAIHIPAPPNPLDVSVVQSCRIERSLGSALTLNNSQPIIRGNEFADNGSFDLYNLPGTSRKTVVATMNYWGRADGPRQVGDTSDAGVSNNVVFNPWLSDPVGARLFSQAEIIAPEFTPQGGQATLVVQLTEPVSWTVTISNSAGGTVATLTGSSSTEIRTSWDGKNQNVSLPAGVYPFRLNARAAGGTTGRLAGQFTLNIDVPAAAITSPAIGVKVTAGVIEIRGTASSAQLQSYRLEFAFADSPNVREVISTATGSSVTNGLLGRWDTTSFLRGDYLLYLVVTDQSGRQSSAQVPITIDSIAVTNVSTSKYTFNPRLGETVTISYTLSHSAAITVTIGGQLAIANQVQSTGAHAVTWNGKKADGSRVDDGAYIFAIIARDTTGRQGVYAEPLVAPLIEVEDLSVVQNKIDGTLQVTYVLTRPADISLSYGTPPRSGSTGKIGTVVPNAPRGPGQQAEVWQYTTPVNLNPKPSYILPALYASVSRRGGGGGGGGGGSAMAILFPPPPVFPPAPPPRNFNPRAEYLVNLDARALPRNIIIVDSQPFDVKPVFVEPPVIIPTFGQAAEIEYTLTEQARVSVGIYRRNAVGSPTLVRKLIENQTQSAGTQSVVWDGRDESDAIVNLGDYIYIIEAINANGETRTRRGIVRVTF